jgi:hypothetical protein
MEGRRLSETVAYGDLGSENPAPITDAYERHREPAIELQLQKSGVRLAYPRTQLSSDMVSDGERTALAIQGAEGKRLTYRQPANRMC